MFSALHALAQKSTLMITISAEDEQLRVTVTPTPAGKDAKQVLRPLSLLASAEELDADFAAAIATWQAPRQSVLEQARAAAEQPDDDDGDDKKETQPKALPAKKDDKPVSKKTAKQAAKGKDKKATAETSPAPVKTDGNWPLPTGGQAESTNSSPATEPQVDSSAAPAVAEPEPANEAQDVPPAQPAATPTEPTAPPAEAEPRDELTLQLF